MDFFFLAKHLKVVDSYLSDDQIKQIAKEHPSHITFKLRARDKKLYNYIDKKYEADRFTEKLYLYLYGEDKRVCNLNGCSNHCNFRRFGSGFQKHCSYDCSGAAKKNRVENECEICEKNFETVESRVRRFCSEECRREYFKTEECNRKRIESHKKSMREKHGKDFYFQTDEFKEKAKQTKIERYGKENYVNYEKGRKTKEERYGDPNYNNQEKWLETINQKYESKDGQFIENISQTREFKKTQRQNQVGVIDRKLPNHIDRDFDIEDYTGVANSEGVVYYKFVCYKCGEKFKDKLDNGNIPSCPSCDRPSQGVSEIENEVCEYVKSILPDHTEVFENNNELLGRKEIDIYIPEKNVAIEFNGIYWHSENGGGKDKDYHLKKTKACEEAGIQLIHIFENEWVLKRDIVKKKLAQILKSSNNDTVYASSCKVETITNEVADKFLEEQHPQGSSQSPISLGLFFENALIGVMTFEKTSTVGSDQNSNTWEIKWFATSKRVDGAARKLFKEFRERKNPDKVITLVDRRWSSKLDNVYDNIGFELENITAPNYYYFKESSVQLYEETTFRKDVLDEKLENFDSDLTEWENMQRHGYDRIWNCGYLKYTWTKN